MLHHNDGKIMHNGACRHLENWKMPRKSTPSTGMLLLFHMFKMVQSVHPEKKFLAQGLHTMMTHSKLTEYRLPKADVFFITDFLHYRTGGEWQVSGGIPLGFGMENKRYLSFRQTFIYPPPGSCRRIFFLILEKPHGGFPLASLCPPPCHLWV